jgi:hypothetical protein
MSFAQKREKLADFRVQRTFAGRAGIRCGPGRTDRKRTADSGGFSHRIRLERTVKVKQPEGECAVRVQDFERWLEASPRSSAEKNKLLSSLLLTS